jgi:hypothetical protein
VVVLGRLLNVKLNKDEKGTEAEPNPNLQYEFSEIDETSQVGTSQIQLTPTPNAISVSTQDINTLEPPVSTEPPAKTKKQYLIEAVLPIELEEWKEGSIFSKVVQVIKVRLHF